MKTAQVFLPLAFLFLVFPVTRASLNESRIIELAEIVGNNPLLNNPKTKGKFFDAIEKIRAEFPECKPNVCFALDGSNSITPTEYAFQKAFVVLATATLGGLQGSKFAAVQYGGINHPIVTLQEPSASFLLTVDADKFQDSSLTLVAPAIQYCRSQMESSPAPVNKMVILGDGKTTYFDNNRFFGAQALAEKFRDASVANEITAGLIGKGKNRKFFLELVGNSKQRVLETSEWSKIVNIIFAFVEQICG